MHALQLPLEFDIETINVNLNLFSYVKNILHSQRFYHYSYYLLLSTFLACFNENFKPGLIYVSIFFAFNYDTK